MIDFAEVAETMAAMLALLPAKHARTFDGAEPITRHWVAAVGGGEEMPIFLNPDHETVLPSDLSRPVRHRLINDMNDHTAYYLGFGIRTAVRAELRNGRQPFPSKQPTLVVTWACLRELAPSREISEHFVSWHPTEQQWVTWRHGGKIDRFNDEWVNNAVRLALAMQFSNRYWWRVLLSYPGSGARLALRTTSERARKLFAARDLPPGRERRAALRHWVTEHYRSADTAPIAVRSHFRGAEGFAWEGLQCEIEPSEYDRDRVGASPAALPRKAGL
jgi:hypothetical protein